MVHKMNGLEPYIALMSLPGGKNKSRSSLYSSPCQIHIHFQPKLGTTILVEFLLFIIMSAKGNTKFRIKEKMSQTSIYLQKSLGQMF